MDDPGDDLIDPNACAHVTEETRTGPPLAYVAEKARTALEELHALCRRLEALERGSHRDVRDGAPPSTWPLDELVTLATQAFRHDLTSYLALHNMLAIAAHPTFVVELLRNSPEQFRDWLSRIDQEGSVT